MLSEHAITLHFSSRKALELSIETKNKGIEKTPAITDHVILLESDDEGTFERVFSDPKFTELSQQWERIFSAHLHRLV